MSGVLNRIRFYAGVGSRETPLEVLESFRELAAQFVLHGLILRSGGAPGADTAFELGAAGAAEIFLPWKDFNGNTSRRCAPSGHAMEVASDVHPAWAGLSRAARALHARNVQQVLGEDLRSPVEFVVCWTPGGGAAGGTATAIRLAQRHDIPVFNFGVPDGPRRLDAFLLILANGRHT